MYYLQHLINQAHQVFVALFTIFLAIWVELRNARKAKGLTIESAAELIGVSPVTYSRWEHGCQKPHPSNQLLLTQNFMLKSEEEDGSMFDDGNVPDAYLPPVTGTSQVYRASNS